MMCVNLPVTKKYILTFQIILEINNITFISSDICGDLWLMRFVEWYPIRKHQIGDCKCGNVPLNKNLYKEQPI